MPYRVFAYIFTSEVSLSASNFIGDLVVDLRPGNRRRMRSMKGLVFEVQESRKSKQ